MQLCETHTVTILWQYDDHHLQFANFRSASCDNPANWRSRSFSSVQILQIVVPDHFLQIVIPDFFAKCCVRFFFAKLTNCCSNNLLTKFKKYHPDHFVDPFYFAKFAQWCNFHKSMRSEDIWFVRFKTWLMELKDSATPAVHLLKAEFLNRMLFLCCSIFFLLIW